MKDQSLLVLLVEDSEDDALLIIRELQKGGYHPEYERVETANAMKKALKEKPWNIILCDYNMPNFSAPSAIALLKESHIDIPVIIVSGTIGEETAIECMRLGAKDYIMKGKYYRLCPAIARELEETKVRKKQKQSEEMLLLIQRAVEGSSDAIGISDPKGRHYYQNKAFTDLLGYTAEELGDRVQQIVFADQSIARHVFETIMNGGSCSNEVEFITKDGRRLIVLLRADAIKDATGKTIGLLAIGTDITEQKHAEESLRNSEEKFRKIFDLAPFAIVITDMEGRYFDVNQMYCKRTMLNKEDIIGRTARELPTVPIPENNNEVERLQKKIFEHGFVANEEITLVRGTDKKRSIILLSAQMVTISGKQYVISMIDDITEHKQAEETRLASEEHLRTIFENAEEIIHLIAWDGTFLYISPSWERYTGFPVSETVGQSFVPYVHPDDQAACLEVVKNVYETGRPHRINEFRVKHASGKWIWFTNSGTAIKDAQGTPLYFSGVASDITERKQADEARRSSEEKYRLLYNNMRDGFVYLNMDGAFRECNAAFEKMIGYTLEELRSLTFEDITPEQWRSADKIKMNKLMQKGHSGIGEKEYKRKDGTIFPVEIRAQTVTSDATGKPFGIWAVVRDITERKQAEERLKQSEEKYRLLATNVTDVIFTMDMHLNYTYISPSISQLVGYSADELMKMQASDIVAPETFRYIVDVFMEELEIEKRADRDLKRSRVLEYQNICKDGSKVWAETTLAFLRDENQKAVGLLGVARNITSRKESEMALEESFERLKKSFGVTINVLISALEMRDPYTAGHQYRVSHIACAIAREMKLDESVIEGIRMAGSIHDIGKLSIPAEILTKPTRLNNLEYSLIKEHPVSGFQMLKGIESPWPLAEIVHQHHERMDGSGYPQKLKGNEILLEARILAVADVVEAMGSHRPYRPSLGIEKALEEIEKNKETLYDATVADACLKLFREKGYQLT